MYVKIRDTLKTAINAYLVLLLLVLPLYVRDGYAMIGNVKYLFFRNVTLFFVLVAAVMQILMAVVQGRERKGVHMISSTDAAVMVFAGSAVLSWCFSIDRYTAWWGTSGWYMGLLSQLMFAWIYFAASRWCGEQKEILWAFFAGATVVMALGLLNRYVYDPLSMFVGLEDWNRTHLLSTIGNSNWYCGYVSVASAVCIHFAYAKNKVCQLAGLVGSLFCFWTIMTQGSEGGYLILVAEMIAALLWSLENRKKLFAFLKVLACWPAAALLGQYCIRFRGLILVEDGALGGLLFWPGWPLVMFLLVALNILLYIRERKGQPDKLKAGYVKKAALWIVGAFFAVGIITFLACQLWEGVWNFLGRKELLCITDSWGNGRGILWRMSIGCFAQMETLHKLIGVGPDCFSAVLYGMYPVNDMIRVAGQWETAIYANAHNEWLNMLVNQGILGLASYAGIFVTLFVRLWKYSRRNSFLFLGILAIAGYCAYGIVSFQQTISTPIMFAVLGISEAALRDIRQ